MALGYLKLEKHGSRGVRNFSIKNAIDKIHFGECSYGCRRIRHELKKQGFQGIGKRRLRRYMEEMGIVPFYPGPNLSKRDLQNRTYPYLLRNVAITHVNQVWGIDITYCGTPHGFIYLVAIIEWHSRLIVGWAMSNTMQSDFVLRAIEEAIKTHGTPEIKAGAERHVDLHLVVAKYNSIVDVHELCDLIEQEINLKLPGTHVLIHAEPASTRDVECPVEEGLGPFCQNCQVKAEHGRQRPDDG